MKTGLRHKLVNNYFEDPCLFVRILWEKKAILFDAGDISNLPAAEIYKISDVFISHTHIDHFIGFDTILRLVLRRDLPLNVYGPPRITACIAGKLKGYEWNLIREYPAVINVFSYNGRALTQSTFRAANGFRKEVTAHSPCDGVLLRTPLFSVRAAMMEHDIPCLAYSIEEESHINIDKDRLHRRGLQVGPWLSDFKKLLRETASGKKKVSIDGKYYSLSELSDIALITRGQKITYATDIGMSERNMTGLIKLARGSDIFFCEAYFLDKDRQRALERNHLTAKTCGSIARKAGVKRLVLMHFSPRYRDCPDLVIKEAMNEFRG